MAYNSQYTDKVVNSRPTMQKFDTNYTPKIDTSKYANMNSAYQNMFNQYKQGGQQYLNTIRKQTQMQMNMLTQQLDSTRAKYQAQGNQMAGRIQQDFEEQDKMIDKQGYNQLKYANQMGSNRGMSASAQQRGLDNYVGQQTSSLMNQNATDRNNSLSDLSMKIASLMADADSEYMTNMTNAMMSGMDKEANYMQQMNQQEFQFQLQNAKDLVNKMEEEGKLKFQTEMQRVQYENQIAMQMYQSDLSVAQNKDSMNFQDMWKEKEYAFDQQKFAHQQSMDGASLALQQQKFAYQKAQDAKANANEKDPYYTEARNELLAQAMQPKKNGGLGMDYLDAVKYVNSTLEEYYKTGTTPKEKKEAVAKKSFQNAMNMPIQDFLTSKGNAIFGAYSPSSTGSLTTGSSSGNFYSAGSMMKANDEKYGRTLSRK